MAHPPIGVQNVSTVCSDAEVRHWVAAIQLFMPEFCAAWGLEPVDVGFLPSGQALADDLWLQVVADDADQADALGYHETTRAGVPIGYTFAATDFRYGAAPSVTLTHELWEMLADPMIDKTVLAPDGRRFAYENCDAVESDADALVERMEGGKPVLLSDFVLPSYFDFAAAPGVPYDYKGVLTSPIPAMRPGGYLAFQNPDGSWGQVTTRITSSRLAQARPPVLSRRYKRMFQAWQPSDR